MANDENQKDENSNALNGKNAYRLFEIKSYAVRVEQAASGSETSEPQVTEVTIASGSITNSSGGGVYVGGGTVTLGDSANNSGPTVTTTGTTSYRTGMNPSNNDNGGNWIYYLPKEGGPAVKVTESNTATSSLYVYGGTYTSQQGDGIVTVGGTSYIHSGTFIGRDNNVKSGDRAGPGASYSFKVYGGEVNVYGGTFGGIENGAYINSSGAFVMGTSATDTGTANIYGGTFVVSDGNTGGQAGFSVYEYGKVLVAPGEGGEQQNLGGEVKMTGLAAGVAIEGNTSNTASVEIKGGEFSSTRDYGNSDAIWYSNENAVLTISNGTFRGAVRSGLYFAVAPNENKVQLSGGTFTGNSAINADKPREITTGNILANNAWCFSRVPTSDWDTDGAICTYEYKGQTYKYTQVGQGNSVRLNESGRGWGLYSFYIQGTNGSPRALNEYETVVIRTGTQITFDR